jgi:predicted glycosyltransferase
MSAPGPSPRRLLIEAHHPAHIHFFKHAVRIWCERGHEVLMLGRDRDVMQQLLVAYDWIPHEVITAAGRNNRFPMEEMLRRQLTVARSIRRFRPEIVLSLMGSYTQSARLFGVPSVIFTDSEFQSFNHRIAHPFATAIYTPECFWKELGAKQRRYAGYHELAFLHPTRFEPRSEVLNKLSAVRGEYLVVRTSAWNTLHDVGEGGFGALFDRFLERVTEKIRVFLVPEGGRLPARWEALRLRVPPDWFHDVLAFARLVVTEGASTASEAACLGVPAVFLNSTERGYLNDQERRYGLVHNFKRPEPALEKTLSLLAEPPDPAELRRARAQLITDHVDVTAWLIAEIDRLFTQQVR